MSVLVRIRGDERFHVYVKGAPETIVKQCKQSTGFFLPFITSVKSRWLVLQISLLVPDNFEEQLLSYTLKGYRVLALATK